MCDGPSGWLGYLDQAAFLAWSGQSMSREPEVPLTKMAAYAGGRLSLQGAALLATAERIKEARERGGGSHLRVTQASRLRAVLAPPLASPAAGRKAAGGAPTRRARKAGPARAARPMACNGWGPAFTCRRTKVEALEPVKNLGVGIQYAELLPEPPERHLDRAILSALGSWRCPLLGLLLGMRAPGGCGSRGLAGGLGILGSRGLHSAGGLSPLWERAWLGLSSQAKFDAPTPPPSPPALQPGSALLLSNGESVLRLPRFPLHLACSL